MPLHEKSAKGIVYIALYVDDNLMVRNVGAIDDVISALKTMGWYLRLWKGCRATCPAK